MPHAPMDMLTTLRRRLAAAGVVVGLLVSMTPSAAFAWANGPNAGNGYGTHDWIIDQAVKVLAGQAGWFDAQAARLRSDDPDTIERAADPAREIEHVYRESGKRGGAVDRVAELYVDAVEHYQAGDYHAASEDIGLLAHFYGDLLNPYHSAAAATGKTSWHAWYEHLVDDQTGRASDRPDWSSTARTVHAISNVRTSAIAAAAYSRKYFRSIHAEMVKTHSRLTSRASQITGYVMKYGAKGLANIIWSVSQGVGLPPPPATLTVRIRYRYVLRGYDFQTVYVSAKDASGHAIEGLAIHVDRPTPGGGVSPVTIWTDPKGQAHTHWDVGASPYMVRRDVGVRASTGDVTLSRPTWYMASPVLASGSAGFRTGVSDRTPGVGQLVTVSSVARDTKGRPVVGLKVTWTWHLGTMTLVTTGLTDTAGRASSSYAVTSATTTSTVTINAKVQSASCWRTSAATFRRH